MFVTKPISALLLAATATALALPEPQTITVNEAGIAAFKRQLSESCNKIQSTYNNIDSGIAGLESDFGEPLGTFTLPHHSFQVHVLQIRMLTNLNFISSQLSNLPFRISKDLLAVL
jgi:hypothetical protein